MSYPSGWDLVNITGTYIARDGTPCTGSVTLSSPQLVLRAGTIVPAADIVFDLVNGAFSGQIPATDDPNASPVGWTYTVTENVPGGRQGIQIVAPHTSPGIDMSTVVPVTMPQPPTFGFPYVTLSQLAGTVAGDGAYLIGYAYPFTGSVARTAQSKLQETISVKDFGAVGDGVTDDTTAIKAAIAAASAPGSGNRCLFFPPTVNGYLISSALNIPVGFTGGIWYGGSNGSVIKASASFVGASLVTCDATLSLMTLRDLNFDCNNVATLTAPINLTRSPESSIQHLLENIRIINVPSNASAITMDGCEDSELIKVSINAASGATGIKALSFHVPAGNISIIGCTWFYPIYVAYQSAGIINSTIGAIYADGPCGTLALDAVYCYADPVNNCNFNTTANTTYGFGSIHIAGSWLSDGLTPAASVCFKGLYQNVVEWHSSYYAGGASGSALLSAATSFHAGQTPYFKFYGNPLAGTTALGTPATGVRVTGGYTPAQVIANGWEITESGLYHQWGSTTVTGAANAFISKSVTFPIALPTAFEQSMSKSWTQGYANGAAQMTTDIDSGNTTGITLVLVSSVTVTSAQQINWEVWGY